MTQTYNADAIEVLTGLEPVRRRPGMYTDTTRLTIWGKEVIDNGVDMKHWRVTQNAWTLFYMLTSR